VKNRLVVYLDRFAGLRQFFVALTAPKQLRQPLIAHAIALATMRTGQQQTAFTRFNGIGDSAHKRSCRTRIKAGDTAEFFPESAFFLGELLRQPGSFGMATTP